MTAADWFYMHFFDEAVGVIPSELLEALRWAQNRPESKSKTQSQLQLSSPNAFTDALTHTESEYMEIYAARWPDSVWQLNQDPRSGHGMHAQHFWLRTMIHNFGLVFTDNISAAPAPWLSPFVSDSARPHVKQPRWLVGTEALTAQAFPIGPLTAIALGEPMNALPLLSSFNSHRPSRSGVKVLGECGNSMNVHVYQTASSRLYSAPPWRCVEDVSILDHNNMRFDVRTSQHAVHIGLIFKICFMIAS
jgi:hypothetical protein